MAAAELGMAAAVLQDHDRQTVAEARPHAAAELAGGHTRVTSLVTVIGTAVHPATPVNYAQAVA